MDLSLDLTGLPVNLQMDDSLIILNSNMHDL